jgi:hypothetical protein
MADHKSMTLAEVMKQIQDSLIEVPDRIIAVNKWPLVSKGNMSIAEFCKVIEPLALIAFGEKAAPFQLAYKLCFALTDEPNSTQYFEILQLAEPDCYEKIKENALRMERLQSLRENMLNMAKANSVNETEIDQSRLENDVPKLPTALSIVPVANDESGSCGRKKQAGRSHLKQDGRNRREQIFPDEDARFASVSDNMRLSAAPSIGPLVNGGSCCQIFSNTVSAGAHFQGSGEERFKKKNLYPNARTIFSINGTATGQLHAHKKVPVPNSRCYSCQKFGHTRSDCSLNWNNSVKTHQLFTTYKVNCVSANPHTKSYSRVCSGQAMKATGNTKVYGNSKYTNTTMERRLRR